MTLTRKMLDTQYAWWFHSKRNTEQAKQEILSQFSAESDDCHEWTEQDIYEQSRPTGTTPKNNSERPDSPSDHCGSAP